MNFKKFFPLSLSFMLLIPISKNINSDSQEVTREVKIKEENLDKQNIYYDYESTLDGSVIKSSFSSKIKDVSNIDYVSLNEIDREILDEVNYSFDIDLINNEIIYSVSINSISISTSSTFDFSQGIINGEFDQDNLKISLKEISKYTSIEQVGLLDFIKRAAEEAKRAIQEAIRKAEELRQKAIEEARRIAEEIRRRAEEEARKAREIIDRAIGEAKNFVSEVINIKNILTGDIDSISKDIEECKSYKDYSKAKSLYDRAQKTLDKAEELNNKVENKSRSTSISEATKVINPAIDLIKALFERAKGMFKKVKAAFESIKTEYSVFNLYSSITLTLPEAIKNFIWNFACSILGEIGVIAKNIAIISTAISNYVQNKETCQKNYYDNKGIRNNPFKNGYIDNQGKIKAKVGFGFDFSEKGCEIAATFNLLKYNGVDIALENLILHFDLMNSYNFAGALGVNPKDISRILFFYGVYTMDRGTDAYKMFDDKLQNGDSGILCYLWIEKEEIKTVVEETYTEIFGENAYQKLEKNIDWDNAVVSIESSLVDSLIFNRLSEYIGCDTNCLVIYFDDIPVIVKTKEFIKLFPYSICAHYIMIYKEDNTIGCYNGFSFEKNKMYNLSDQMSNNTSDFNACLAGFYVL